MSFKGYSSKRAAIRGAVRIGLDESVVYQDMETEQFGFDVPDDTQTEPKQDEYLAGIENRAEPQVEAPVEPAVAVTTTTRKIEKERLEQNGVKMPSAGTLCRAVWDFCSATPNCTAKDVKTEAEKQGWNANNASIEFYNWRKFNGIVGRQKTAPQA